MRRKVVKHGSSTLTISMPSKWVKAHSIKAGDELEVLENKGQLIIRVDKEVERPEVVELNIEDLGFLTAIKALSALYKSGCDSILVHFNEPEKISWIETVIPELVGFEIMSQSEHSCLIKEVSRPANDTDTEELIKRIFLLIISIADDMLKNSTQAPKIINNVVWRDKQINKFCNLCRRVLNKRGVLIAKEVTIVYYIVDILEKIADEYKDLGKYLVKNKIIISNGKIISIFNSVNNFIREFFSLYFKFNLKNCRELCEKIWNKIEEIGELYSKLKEGKETRICTHLHKIAEHLLNMLGPLMTMRLPPILSPKSQI